MLFPLPHYFPHYSTNSSLAIPNPPFPTQITLLQPHRSSGQLGNLVWNLQDKEALGFFLSLPTGKPMAKQVLNNLLNDDNSFEAFHFKLLNTGTGIFGSAVKKPASHIRLLGFESSFRFQLPVNVYPVTYRETQIAFWASGFSLAQLQLLWVI